MVPYHHARWDAFASRNGAECHVIELTNHDEFNVLEFSAPARYIRHTLFPQCAKSRVPTFELRRKFWSVLDEIDPHVVCISGYAQRMSLAAMQWATNRGLPLVVLSESNEFDERRSWPKEWLKRRLLRLCSAGLAGGRSQSEYLTRLGLPPGSVSVGYDVVDNQHFAAGLGDRITSRGAGRNRAHSNPAPEPERGTSRPAAHSVGCCFLPAVGRDVPRSGVVPEWANLSLPHKYFLACSRFGSKKNIPGAITAYARYVERFRGECGPMAQPWHFVIIGDGERRQEIEQTVDRFSLQNLVHLPGAIGYKDLARHYSLAGAFVHASTTEQWGLVVNEAMASGLPVLVSSRCGCAPELVRDGVNGFTFDPYNFEELADLMLRVSAADFPRAAFGEASRRIIADWGPERFASGLHNAIDVALRAPRLRATWLDRALLWALTHRRGA